MTVVVQRAHYTVITLLMANDHS